MRRRWQRGVKVTGATVHFVDSGMDTGPILLQKAVEVQQGDTPETSAAAGHGGGGVENFAARPST